MLLCSCWLSIPYRSQPSPVRIPGRHAPSSGVERNFHRRSRSVRGRAKRASRMNSFFSSLCVPRPRSFRALEQKMPISKPTRQILPERGRETFRFREKAGQL
jgi:hypothetical protein